jgi:hypothetical protein
MEERARLRASAPHLGDRRHLRRDMHHVQARLAQAQDARAQRVQHGLVLLVLCALIRAQHAKVCGWQQQAKREGWRGVKGTFVPGGNEPQQLQEGGAVGTRRAGGPA